MGKKNYQEWEERMKKWEEEREKSHKEWEERHKKIDIELEKTRKMVYGLTGGWGRFTEGLIIPSLDKILHDFGLNVIDVASRKKRRKKDEEMEVDVLSIAERDGVQKVIVVEAKTYLTKRDVDDFISSMANFFYFFDEYKGKEVIGFVAYMDCERGAIAYAEKQGLYVLGPSDDVMVIKNKSGFKPKIWK